MENTDASKAEFDADIKRLLDVSEMITLGYVNFYGDRTVIESIFQRTV